MSVFGWIIAVMWVGIFYMKFRDHLAGRGNGAVIERRGAKVELMPARTCSRCFNPNPYFNYCPHCFQIDKVYTGE